jgi:hypothetical protein
MSHRRRHPSPRSKLTTKLILPCHKVRVDLESEEHRKVEVILEERHDRDSLGINYEHIRSYSFNLKHTDEFILAVEFDHKIKGAANAYMEVDNSYIEMSYKEGEQTRLVIFEDMRTVVYNKQFYHATGFDFEAKKGREYLFRYIKEGTNKLIIMYLENFMAEGKTEANLLTDVATDHQRRTNEVKNKLMVDGSLLRLSWAIRSRPPCSTSASRRLFRNTRSCTCTTRCWRHFWCWRSQLARCTSSAGCSRKAAWSDMSIYIFMLPTTADKAYQLFRASTFRDSEIEADHFLSCGSTATPFTVPGLKCFSKYTTRAHTKFPVLKEVEGTVVLVVLKGILKVNGEAVKEGEVALGPREIGGDEENQAEFVRIVLEGNHQKGPYEGALFAN